MILGDLFRLGERLAGRSDRRLRRGLVLALGEALATSAPYAALLFFLRALLERRLTPELIALSTLAVAIAVGLRLLLSQAAMSDIFVACYGLMGHARLRIADHLRRLPMGFFTQQRSGDLAGVLTSDIAFVEEVWSHLLGVFAASFALPLLVGLGLCLLDLRLGLIVVATLPVALGILALTTPLFVRRMGSVLAASADANARIVEYVQGIAVLRVFGRHGEVFQRLVAAMERLRDALIRADVAPAPLLSVFGFVVEGGFVVLAFAGSRLALTGDLAAGDLLVFLVVSLGVGRQVADLGVALLMLRGSLRALERVDALLAEPPLAEPERPLVPVRFDVSAEGVTFGYDGPPVLKGVDAAFRAGALTAVVGGSGAGKSTLVHLIARLWDIPRGQGTIRIGGVDVREMAMEELQRRISIVFQDIVLFSGTIRENLSIGRPDASPADVERAARMARAHDFILALPEGYDTPLAVAGASLSGGERQRLSIARAILDDAPIVILDEATASVDALTETDIQAAFDELVRHKTVIAIAHRLRSIQRADQIIVLDRGRVAETGTHAELLQRGAIYAALWHEQERARGWRLSTAERRASGSAAAAAEQVHR